MGNESDNSRVWWAVGALLAMFLGGIGWTATRFATVETVLAGRGERITAVEGRVNTLDYAFRELKVQMEREHSAILNQGHR